MSVTVLFFSFSLFIMFPVCFIVYYFHVLFSLNLTDRTDFLNISVTIKSILNHEFCLLSTLGIHSFELLSTTIILNFCNKVIVLYIMLSCP